MAEIGRDVLRCRRQYDAAEITFDQAGLVVTSTQASSNGEVRLVRAESGGA